tara:strand:- start:82 stop:213 length:132 start_codon:yes stop_codon:yes gene_type:complete
MRALKNYTRRSGLGYQVNELAKEGSLQTILKYLKKETKVDYCN